MSVDHTNGEIEFSGASARFWGWVMASWPRKILERLVFGNPADRILAYLALEGDERVLDAGAGSGYYSLNLARQLPRGQVVALDISPTMLDILARGAKRRKLQKRIAIREGDCGAIPLADAEMDNAITVAVWHHVPDSQLAVRELFRVLKPGGKVVAVDWIASGGHHHRHQEKEWIFDSQAMTAHLNQAGFGSIKVETLGRWVIGFARKPIS